MNLTLRKRKPLPQKGMSWEQIRAEAPVVFTNAPVSKASDHYLYISSVDVIGTLAQNGWYVHEVKQINPRKKERIGYQKHLVIFRNDLLKIDNDNFISLIMTNSYDTMSSFRLNLGVFRFICANGMVTGESFQKFATRHFDYNEAEIQTWLNHIKENSGKLIALVKRAMGIKLSNREKLRLAKKIAKNVWGEKEPKDLMYQTMLHPRREADNGNDLWSVFNVIQENVIKGGVAYRAYSKKNDETFTKTTRGTRSVDGYIKMNQNMWKVFEEKAAA